MTILHVQSPSTKRIKTKADSMHTRPSREGNPPTVCKYTHEYIKLNL
jgi:hypothetical protein